MSSARPPRPRPEHRDRRRDPADLAQPGTAGPDRGHRQRPRRRAPAVHAGGRGRRWGPGLLSAGGQRGPGRGRARDHADHARACARPGRPSTTRPGWPRPRRRSWPDRTCWSSGAPSPVRPTRCGRRRRGGPPARAGRAGRQARAGRPAPAAPAPADTRPAHPCRWRHRPHHGLFRAIDPPVNPRRGRPSWLSAGPDYQPPLNDRIPGPSKAGVRFVCTSLPTP